MDSDTSTEANINLLDKNGNKLDLAKKPDTSSTNEYFEMLNNPGKIKEESEEISDNLVSDYYNEDSSVKSESSKSSKSSKSFRKSVRSTKSSKSDRNRTEKKLDNRSESRNDGRNDGRTESRTENRTDAFTDNMYTDKPSINQIKKELTPQEMRLKKIDLLRKLSEIKSKGYDLSKEYNFNSDIDEMEYEYELLKSFAAKRNGIKFWKSTIVNIATGVEFFNDKYDPFNAQLEGWSEHMNVEIDSYEDVIEELYEKYKGAGKNSPPELKLLLLMVTSATAFHFTKSALSDSKTVKNLMQKNPDLVANLLGAKKNDDSQFMTQQEINLQQQKRMAIEREKMERQRLRQPMPNVVQSQNDTYQNNYNPAFNMNPNPAPKPSVNIRPPSNVQEILSRIHKNDNETQEETESMSKRNSRLMSETTLTSDTNGNKKPRKKPMISIM
jgi:hypothetical protein